jgi:hypothetical protein
MPLSSGPPEAASQDKARRQVDELRRVDASKVAACCTAAPAAVDPRDIANSSFRTQAPFAHLHEGSIKSWQYTRVDAIREVHLYRGTCTREHARDCLPAADEIWSTAERELSSGQILTVWDALSRRLRPELLLQTLIAKILRLICPDLLKALTASKCTLVSAAQGRTGGKI